MRKIAKIVLGGNNMKNKAITPRNEDFARWYDDVVKAARLATYSGIKGCFQVL